MIMEVQIGAASVQDKASEVFGFAHGGSGAVGSEHVLVLEINGKIVQFISRTLIPVKDGDIIAAAGPLKDGILRAKAIANISNGVNARSYARIIGRTRANAWATLLASIFFFFLVFTIPIAFFTLMHMRSVGRAANAVEKATREYNKR